MALFFPKSQVLAQTSGKVTWSSGFYPGWQQGAYPPSTLPWNAITVLNQFSLMTGSNRDGSINTTAHSLTPTLMQAAVSEAHKQKRKIFISIGGAEDNNWDGACSSTNRTIFINNLVSVVKQYGYDGVDLDIEQDWGAPAHTDYIACVSGIRTALNAFLPAPNLSEDGDPDWQGYMLVQVWQYLDQINLMSYGATVSSGTITTEINNYTSLGIPASMLSIGVGLEAGEADVNNTQDCTDKAAYAAGSGSYNSTQTVYGGVMEWTVPDDAANNSGQFLCLNAISPYVNPASGVTPLPTPIGATPTPTPTRAPSPTQSLATPTPGGSALVIYDNGMENGFTDNSFGYTTKNSCDTSSFVSSPCSYAVAYSGWGGLNFTAPTGLMTGPYTSIDYNINTGGLPITDFSVLLLNTSGGELNEVILSQSNITQTLSNGWVHISMPMSQFSTTSVGLGAVQLKNALNQNLATIHIDDVQLLGGNSQLPTPTLTSAPTNTQATPTPVVGDGDVNNDGKVDNLDAKAVLSAWFQTATSMGGANQYGDTIINSMDFGVVVTHLPVPTPTSGTGGNTVPPMPLISRGLPVYASSQQYPVTNVNDSDYATQWRSNGAGWVAFDLSSVPVANRKQVMFAWYNDPTTSPYEYNVINDVPYNIPGGYTIEGNPAASGSSAPTSGWVTLATVTGNTAHSRQHLINLSGYNWVRMNVTAIDGSTGNTDVAINIDIHDASLGAQDSWIFFGDSITQDGMFHTTVNGVNNFAQLINASKPGYYPAYEDGGIGGTATADGVTNINRWLTQFPGHFVTLDYGTNNDCGNPTQFYSDYKTMTTAIINAGKVPVVPTFPHSPNLATTCSQLITQIDNLYNDPTIVNGKTLGSQIVKGPDFWNTTLTYRDGLHPTDAGYGIMRQLWASTMISNVYNTVQPTTGASPTGTVSLTPTGVVPTATRTPTPAVPTATPTPGSGALPGVHVSGNTLLDATGKQVVLRGVNRSGTEYACIQGWGIFDGPNATNDDLSIPPIRSWGNNGVNVGINEDCWLNINMGTSTYGGTTYINAIKHYVQTIEQNGMYPVISLFWEAAGTGQATGQIAMPDNDHAPAVWQSLANTFKSDPSVIFRLKEEPYPAGNTDTTSAWDCWSHGDVQYGASGSLTPTSQTSHCSEGYKVVGMQSLINIIRGTGAQNVIQVPGVEYANSMTHFLDAAYKVSDTLSSPQLMGVVDVYPDLNPCGTTTCFNTYYAPVIAQMPFIAGEFGESVNGNICSTTNDDTIMNWFDQHNSGYLAWTWDTWGTSCGDLSLITSYDGTPKSPNGVDYKNHLQTVLASP